MELPATCNPQPHKIYCQNYIIYISNIENYIVLLKVQPAIYNIQIVEQIWIWIEQNRYSVTCYHLKTVQKQSINSQWSKQWSLLHLVGQAILNLLLTVAVDKCGVVAKFHGENQFLVKGGPLFIFLSPGVKLRYEYRAVDTTV